MVADVVANNIAANSAVNRLAGNRIEFIPGRWQGAIVRLLAVASAVALDHEMFVGEDNPLVRSGVSVSATPNDLIEPDNVVIGGVGAYPGDRLILNTFETAGVATNDYRARVLTRRVAA